MLSVEAAVLALPPGEDRAIQAGTGVVSIEKAFPTVTHCKHDSKRKPRLHNFSLNVQSAGRYAHPRTFPATASLSSSPSLAALIEPSCSR
jgi:hypothetical protein